MENNFFTILAVSLLEALIVTLILNWISYMSGEEISSLGFWKSAGILIFLNLFFNESN